MPTEIIPVAIYTRKSKAAQLEDEVHSLSVQREKAESYIANQTHLGWQLLEEHFDDNDVNGDTLERPALQRLKERIEAGGVKVVVVNRLDRISRSLSQFMELNKFFEAHGVTLVSSTQHFSTGDATGEFMRHILLSFAEFEHDLIRDRVTERIHTARKEGSFAGAQPMLGYNTAPYSGKLIVDEEEAIRVRAIFQLYLEFKSVRATARELKQRGWNNKRWFTKKGKARGGGPFSANGLHKLLTNPIYIGNVRLNDETFNGKHQAIVDQELFEVVQNTLKKNRQCDNPTRKKHEFALLHDILYCPFCKARYVHHTAKRGSRIYRYYSCGNQRANGIEACDAPTLQAGRIENLVIKQLTKIGFDPEMQTQIIEQIQEQAYKSGETGSLPSSTRLQAVFTDINLSTTTHYKQCKLVRTLLQRVELDSVNEKLKLDFNEEEIIRQALLQDV